MILKGSCVGQVMLIGVDDVVCQITNEKHAEICLPAPACEVDTTVSTDDVIFPGHQWVGPQSAGGPVTTKLYDPEVPIPEPTGILQSIASRILMEILRAARMCRYDLLRVVCGLASCAAKWTHQCDSGLRRLICCINTTKHHSMIGWCGDPDTILGLRVTVMLTSLDVCAPYEVQQDWRL
jgi:hypothetical protein